MLIKSFKIHKKWLLLSLIFLIIIVSFFLVYSFANGEEENSEKEQNFIKWVDFNVTAEALNLTAKLDIDSHNSNAEIKYNWIELLVYLACKNGGDFKNFKKNDLDTLINKLKEGETISELTRKFKIL